MLNTGHSSSHAGPARRQDHRHRGGALPQGMAALTVVMVLFFIMALVAAYTNRNLVFEQRTAANSYKSERALLAADAAVDWALTQLNSGRVDTRCEPSSDTSNLDYRRRYLTLSTSGGYSVVKAAASSDPLYTGCLIDGSSLSCTCTSAASPTPSLSWSSNTTASAFRVSFEQPGLAERPGAITVEVRGCATPGTSALPCVNNLRDQPAADALSNVRVSLGLVRALPNPPAAALTVAGDASAASGAELRISNPDPGTGMSLHAGGTITGTQVLSGPAGSPGNGSVSGDASLSTPLPAQTTLNLLRRQFLATYGMLREEFMRQPALVRVNCSAGCDTARLVQVINAYPRRTLWISGNLTLNSLPTGGGALGSDTEPVMIIVAKADPDDASSTDGVLTVQAGVTINGFVHAEGGINWSAGAAGAQVNGALVSGAGVTANGHLSVGYRRDLLDLIKLGYGSFVRVPGSWNRPA